MNVLKVLNLFFLFPLIFHSCQTLQISKDTRIDIRVKEGETYDLNCVTDENWDFCTWTNINSDKKCRIVQDNSHKKECLDLRGSDIDHERVWSYHINNNTCTLRIADAITEDSSQWNCLIHSGVALVEATINVTVYTPTKLDFKTRPHRAVHAGNFSHFRYIIIFIGCLNLSWFFKA